MTASADAATYIPRELPGWFARIRKGAAYAVGTWKAMTKPVDGASAGASAERVSALPRNDPSWTAAYIVDKVMDAGREKHAEDEWLTQMAFEDHLKAAKRHLQRIKGGPVEGDVVTLSKDGTEDHLNNALCRLAMAVELRRRDPRLGVRQDTTDDARR